MKLELAYKRYTHRVLCTLEKKAANWALHFSVKKGRVFIYILRSIHKMKNKLGAWGGKSLYLATETYRKFLT